MILCDDDDDDDDDDGGGRGGGRGGGGEVRDHAFPGLPFSEPSLSLPLPARPRNSGTSCWPWGSSKRCGSSGFGR